MIGRVSGEVEAARWVVDDNFALLVPLNGDVDSYYVNIICNALDAEIQTNYIDIDDEPRFMI